MSCELLSKNCIFDILNNIEHGRTVLNKVVNCFQKIVSLIFWTTFKIFLTIGCTLWIAFKKLYLWYSEQRRVEDVWTANGCELLSKNCIFDILNNSLLVGDVTSKVVNCFQKIVSLIFWTTDSPLLSINDLLWIAFKKLYLWYSEQPTIPC